MIAAERETTVTTSDADDTVSVWSAQRRHIDAMRAHARFREVRSGVIDGTEWAEFVIPAGEWSPARGARRVQSAAQRAQSLAALQRRPES